MRKFFFYLLVSTDKPILSLSWCLLSKLLHLPLKFHLISIAVALSWVHCSFEAGCRGGPPKPPSVAGSKAQFFYRVNIFSENAQRQVKLYFLRGEEARNYFLSPITTARKRRLFSQQFTKYTIYSSPAHRSPIIRNRKIWWPKGWTIVSETLKYQRERDTRGHPTSKQPPNLRPQNYTLKGTELDERNCKTTRTKTFKVKQMYEVGQSTNATLKAAKKASSREKT